MDELSGVLTEIKGGVASVNARLDVADSSRIAVEKGVQQIGTRLDAVENRLGEADKRLAGIEAGQKSAAQERELFEAEEPGIPDFKTSLNMTKKEMEIAGLGDAEIAHIKSLQRQNDFFCLAATLKACQHDKKYELALKDITGYDRFLNRARIGWPLRGKVLYTTGTGAGAEWIPVEYSAEIYERLIQGAGPLLRVFARRRMPNKTASWPVLPETLDPVYHLAEATTKDVSPYTEASYTTARVQPSAETLGARLIATYEEIEDSIIDVTERVQTDIVEMLNRGIEWVMDNGDTDGSFHVDVTAGHRGRAWDGFGKLATAQSSTYDLSTLTVENFRALLALMGEYGVVAEDLVCVVGDKSWYKLLTLEDSSGNQVCLTMDKLGSQATMITGQIAAVLGIPVVYSRFIRKDLASTGAYTGTGNTKSCLFVIHKKAFVLGERVGVAVESEREAKYRQLNVYASWRGDFVHMVPSLATGNATAAMGTNIP